MSMRCQLTGKRLNRAHKVSHANNKTKRVQLPNLQVKRVFVTDLGQWVKLRISTRALRTLNHRSLLSLLKEQGLTLADVGVKLPEKKAEKK
jgi:large subunit ribosomal protein L28